MNTNQIKYFLAAARTLNFTEAARQLYISQPALSKQISAIESDLNMQLFIRNKNKVRLTPAGLVLLKELPSFEDHYDDIVRKAKIANEGNAGDLTIGILEGQMLGQEFTTILGSFSQDYPNISLRLIRDTFAGLRQQLEEQSIDLAITLSFDIDSHPGFSYETIATCPAVAAISKHHPLAEHLPEKWEDLKGQTFLAISEKGSATSARLIFDDCARAGFKPIIKYANSLETAMLWIEAGIGIGFINSMNNLTRNPDVILLDKLPYRDTYSVLAKHDKNINPAISLFMSYYDGKIS